MSFDVTIFDRSHFVKTLYQTSQRDFEQKALALFRYQVQHCEVYASYVRHLSIDIAGVQTLSQIPFLPIEFFKSHKVVSSQAPVEMIYESSGTTGSTRSQHHVQDVQHYLRTAQAFFEQLYGPLTDYHFFALLPSYLDRQNSSLVAMVDHFIQQSGSDQGGFYLNNVDQMVKEIEYLRSLNSKKIILIGVTFALISLAQSYSLDWEDIIVMETGGMKGRGKELIRTEVHQILKKALGLQAVHSEYGMTELLSQSYALQEGHFKLPSWMKIVLREINDPFAMDDELTAGVINVIDLANIDSCAFIETKDIAKAIGPNEWDIVGRVDNSDIRGCNLLVS